MKFRQMLSVKQNIVDAEQWWPGKNVNGVCLCDVVEWPHLHDGWGTVYNVGEGHWIVTTRDGEIFAMHTERFAATYEAVVE